MNHRALVDALLEAAHALHLVAVLSALVFGARIPRTYPVSWGSFNSS